MEPVSWEKRERRQPGPSRLPAQLRVEFLEKPIREAVTINVSHNGMLVRAPHDREIDSFVRLRLFLPPRQEPVEILGRIASKIHTGGKEALGIHFIDFPSEEKEKWMIYLQRIDAISSGRVETTSPEAHVERRITVRTVSALMVRFKTSEGLEEFITRNVSTGGMFLATTMVKPVGERVKLVVVHPVTDQTFELDAEVVRVDGQGISGELMGIALRFLNLDPQREELLKRFMSTSAS